MVDFTGSTTPTTSETFMAQIRAAKYNPSLINEAAINLVSDLTNGKIILMDPTTPVVLLYEQAAVTAAATMIEGDLALNKLYPPLAQSEGDLYRHMSDKDFIGRFATPALAPWDFYISYDNLVSKMVYDAVEGCDRATLPRNTECTVGQYTFSLQYPIDIRRYPTTDKWIVSYDSSAISPVQPLTSSIIPHRTLTDRKQNSWVTFTVDLLQCKVRPYYFTIQNRIFNEPIALTQKFYYARGYMKTATSGNQWIEVKTTHTDQVYDPYEVTLVLKVTDSVLTVYIPPVYILSGMITGEIRVDVYETYGNLTVNLSDYSQLKSFNTNLDTYIDRVNDQTPYVLAMRGIEFFSSSTATVSGGTDGLDFETLRTQVINNATGTPTPPITGLQSDSRASKYGFEMVSHIDVVTDRVMLATRELPPPINQNLITPANIGVDTFITTIEALSETPEVFNNGNRFTIPSNTLMVNNNGVLQIVPTTTVNALKALQAPALVDAIGSTSYLYSPFHYVVDVTDQLFDVRAYYLDTPSTDLVNVVSHNPTMALQVNTAQYLLEKTLTGYRFTVITESDSGYQNLDNSSVSAQLCFTPAGESRVAGIAPTSVTKDPNTQERRFVWDIACQYDIDRDDHLFLTNFEMFQGSSVQVATPLNNLFTVIYTTTSLTQGFVPSASDSKLLTWIVPGAAISEEAIPFTFGYALSNLWVQKRSPASGLEYQRYTTDVPRVYEADVFDRDPTTGSIFTMVEDPNHPGQTIPNYTILHRRNDPVLDPDGNIVYLHKVGDVILGGDGNPLLQTSSTALRYIDLLLVDGLYFFATDANYVSYRQELANVLVTYITEDLKPIADMVLEKTRVFYYPKKALGLISVMIGDDVTASVSASQAFEVVLYVVESIYLDTLLKSRLTRLTVVTLNEAIKASLISMSDITSTLKSLYGTGVVAFDIKGLGGTLDYPTVAIVNQHERMSLKKELMALESGALIVQEAVNVRFVKYTT